MKTISPAIVLFLHTQLQDLRTKSCCIYCMGYSMHQPVTDLCFLVEYCRCRDVEFGESSSEEFTEGPTYLNLKFRTSEAKNISLKSSCCRTTYHGFLNGSAKHALCCSYDACDAWQPSEFANQFIQVNASSFDRILSLKDTMHLSIFLFI